MADPAIYLTERGFWAVTPKRDRILSDDIETFVVRALVYRRARATRPDTGILTRRLRTRLDRSGIG